MNTLPIPRFHMRCDLFSVAHSSSDDISMLNNMEFQLQTQSDFTAVLRGPQRLDQQDKRIFWRAWLLAKNGEWTEVRLRDLAGAGANRTNTDSVLTALRKLARSTIEIIAPGRRYIHGLLGLTENGDRIRVRVDPQLLRQLAGEPTADEGEKLGYTRIDIDAEHKFGRTGLAGWLGPYLLTHRESKPIALAEIRRLSGSRSSMKEFRRLAKSACQRLSTVGITAEVIDDQIRWRRDQVALAEQVGIKKIQFESVDLNIAMMIWQRVQIVNPAIRQPNIESWANEIRLLREKDDRSVDLIRKVFMWANRDNFWCGNILSAKTLRMKFPTLMVQMNRPPTRPTMASVNAGGRGKLVL